MYYEMSMGLNTLDLYDVIYYIYTLYYFWGNKSLGLIIFLEYCCMN